ncbi:MAG TPA: hypothetical protein VM287_07330 [Egibacteraceae bacterium]|nr:hypothetical protein [Egibacteraceae bacterium]
MNEALQVRGLRHGFILLVALSFLLALLPAVPAAASHVQCGQVITQDTTLDSDVGPCPGHGVIIGANNVTLNLNGFSIIGDPAARPSGELINGSRDRAGVLFRQVTGSMVMSGTVRGFDAGVAIMGGGNNTAHFMTLRDNINYRVVTGQDFLPVAASGTCLFGEGVAVFNSSGNRIEDNILVNNGPLSGIALVGDSDNNQVLRNQLTDHDVINRIPGGTTNETNTICGTGANQGPMTQGRAVQSIGIRIEGPGADGNRVEANTVTRSAIAGIGVHGYICASAPNNGNNVIHNNTVTRTGERTVQLDAIADGIATLATGPAGTVCVSHSNTITSNTSTNNMRDGIWLGGRGSHSNTVNDNVVDNNARNGITVSGPAGGQPGAINNTLHRNRGQGNPGFDGADFNENCDNNDWQNNVFGTVNQECVRAQQTTTTTVAPTTTTTVAPTTTTTVPPDGANPQSRGDCQNGGWQDYGFRNQGQCIQFVNTGKDSRP